MNNDQDWGECYEGAERERYVQFRDALRDCWDNDQCDYLAFKLVHNGFSLTSALPDFHDEPQTQTVLLAAVELRRQDEAFMGRLHANIAKHKPIIDRLGGIEGGANDAG